MPAVVGQRKKKCTTIALFWVLLFSLLITPLLVSLAKANPYLYDKQISPPSDVKPLTISVHPLENNTVYASNSISLTLNVSIPETEAIAKYYLQLGVIWYQTDWNDSDVIVYAYGGSGSSITDFSGDLTLAEIPDGSHNVTFIARVDGGYPAGLTWYWFELVSSSTVYFSVDTISPSVSILSNENRTYETSDVPLNFTVNEAVTLVSYSLDGQANVTVAGNTTLAGLSVGAHNVTVYAWDAAGNVGASETVTFTVEAPEPFPAVPVAAASGLAIASAAVCIFYYRKKRSH